MTASEERQRILDELKRIEKRWTRGRNIAEKETVRFLLADVREAVSQETEAS